MFVATPGKRGFEGDLISDQPQDNNNGDLKKARFDGRAEPGYSKVVHIRQIPFDTTEAEIIQLGLPFGQVTNILLLKGKNQAFIEMADLQAAVTMVGHFTLSPAVIRGIPVFVQFSNHKQLRTDARGGPTFPGAIMANQENFDLGGPKTVLRVVVENMVYPVTLDALHTVFSRSGRVLKIVTFTKANSFQALVQYGDAASAAAAKATLDGQNIYHGCCTLRIEDSKLSNLNVKYNNDKSRDYTNPGLMNGDVLMEGQDGRQAFQTIQLPGQNSQLAGLMGLAGLSQNGMGAGGLSGLTGNGFPGLGGASSALAQLMGGQGNLHGMAGLGLGLGGNPLAGGLGIHGLTPSQGNHLVATGPQLPIQMGGAGSVLLVSNLNSEQCDPDKLFMLFGVYGDVLRVKILYNKKDTAMIQMTEPHQAQLALSHLDRLKLWGQEIRVTLSKHQSVQLPKEGQGTNAGLTKDYTNSPIHRFKKPGSKNYQNIYPPSATLHLSNIPASIDEPQIIQAFTEAGGQVQAFRFFAKDRKMALLQMVNLEDAVYALMKMHNHQWVEGCYLRVSFSKSIINVD